MRKRMLVVQDQGLLISAAHGALHEDAFEVELVRGFAHAQKVILDFRPALILVEIVSWNMSTEAFLCELGVLRSARASRKIILAGSASMQDKVLALEAGADDFLLSSISPRELCARLEAVLRSYVPPLADEDEQSVGVLRLRRNGMEVVVGNEIRKLSRTEFNLLAFLMDHPGHVVTREVLLENIWLPSNEIEHPRTVDVYICRLREKIESNPAEPTRLITRRGYGYSLIDPSKMPSDDGA